MGGGALGGFTPSADVVARAVIASASVYGDDPLDAMVSTEFGGRRCLSAAAMALADVLPIQIGKAARLLGLNAGSVKVAAVRKQGSFVAARTAAARAVNYATWRPEAAASVIGSDEPPVAAPASEAGSDVVAAVIEPIAEIAQPRRAAPSREPVVSPAPRAALPHHSVAALDVHPEFARRPSEPPALAPPRRPSTPSWVEGEAALGDRILAELAREPRSSMSLATILDAKESAVCGSLNGLRQAGKVESGPLPESGMRHQLWSVA